MEALLPFLKITDPMGRELPPVVVAGDRITIGRFQEFNDIALLPDPQKLVTRSLHCFVERVAREWSVVDNGSVNRTFIHHAEDRENEKQVIEGRAALVPGDTILILGLLTERGEPLYWKLTFHDPLGTEPTPFVSTTLYLVYDPASTVLLRIHGREQQEIRPLTPNEHKLISYMEWRNKANGYVAVICSTQELVVAVWERDIPGKNVLPPDNLRHLIQGLRKKLEPDPTHPKLLETMGKLGYRLITQPPSQKRGR